MSEASREHVRRLIDAKGIAEAARRIGVSRHAFERAAFGLTVQRGTISIIEAKLAERRAAGKNP